MVNVDMAIGINGESDLVKYIQFFMFIDGSNFIGTRNRGKVSLELKIAELSQLEFFQKTLEESMVSLKRSKKSIEARINRLRKKVLDL